MNVGGNYLKNYKPTPKTMKQVPEIKRLYEDEKQSISKIAKLLGTSQLTVSNVVKHYLKIERSRSDTQRNAFNNLTVDQKENFFARSKEVKNDKGYKEKLSKTKSGTLNPQHKLKEKDVLQIRKEYHELLQKEQRKTEIQHLLAEKYNVKRPTISDIVLNRTWKYLNNEE